MAEQHIQAKLIALLKLEKIQLWLPPFTTDNNEASQQQMQELAVRFNRQVGFPLRDVENALEDIRTQAVKRGEGNKTYRETNVATLQLHLPKGFTMDGKNKWRLETKLDITTQDLMNMITEKVDIKHMSLILNGKKLSPDKRLDAQNVKNNSTIMVLKVCEPESKREMVEAEEKKRLEDKSVQRTRKVFEILSERDGSEDPETTPFLEIADQKGNPIQIPAEKKKALMLAMGLHEKGRALMKRKEYAGAVDHLLLADEQFRECSPTLLTTVDNYAVLQLDIGWCYRALEALDCLQDCKERLQTAETCFLKCYGEDQQRLQQIKPNTGGEDVLFLRLYLLQSLLAYVKGYEKEAREKHRKAKLLYTGLSLDTEKMMQLMRMGFSEQDARLGLRACRGNVEHAVGHITERIQAREEGKRKEQEMRRRRVQDINTLMELGFGKNAAARVLHDTGGDVDEAYRRLLDSNEAQSSGLPQPYIDRQTKVDQMIYMGFQREAVEAALRFTGDDVAMATKMLLDNQGEVPADMLSPSSPSSSSEEPSTSDSTASGLSSSLDTDLVNEVLEDIPRHEEDYLDVTLEEEAQLIAELESFLMKSSASTS